MCCYIPTRFVLCAMVLLGYFNLYTLRNSLSVAVIAMKDSGVVPQSIWNLPSHDVIISSFYPTYIVANIFGGSLALRVGSKNVFGLGVLVSAFMSFLIPLATHTSYIFVMAIRFLQGISEGLSMASVFTLFGKWFPKSERASLRAVCHSGMGFGFLIGHPLTGYLSASQFLGGWPSVFYTFGFIGLVWFVLWWILVSEEPIQHSWISQQELDYILQDQGEEHARNETKIPWGSILRSPAVMCLVFNAPVAGTFKAFLTADFPTYLRNVYSYDITKIGWLSMFPHISAIVISTTSCFFGDYILNRYPTISRTFLRKCFHTAAEIPSIIALLAITQLGDDPITAVALMTAAFGTHGLNAAGSEIGPVELSPVFAGTVYGIMNAAGNLSAFTAPLIIGAITAEKQSSREAWNVVFYLSAATYGVVTITYLVFGSADLQPWGLGEKDCEKEKLIEAPPGRLERKQSFPDSLPVSLPALRSSAIETEQKHFNLDLVNKLTCIDFKEFSRKIHNS